MTALPLPVKSEIAREIPRQSGKMEDEQFNRAARRRGRGSEASARAEALQRLKALRSGGRRNSLVPGGGYDVKLEDPIYDTVDEEEYGALVARRREEVRGFVVDDGDGNGLLGYIDDGEEEDWSKSGLPVSSDESDGGGRLKKKKMEKKVKDQTQQQHVKRSNPSLTAAAAMMGKQRLSSMFTSSSFRKNKETEKVKCESIVDEIIAEFTPDEADRERRRRGKQVLPPVKSENRLHSALGDGNSVEIRVESGQSPVNGGSDGLLGSNSQAFGDQKTVNGVKEEKVEEAQVGNEAVAETSRIQVNEVMVESKSKDAEAQVVEIKQEPEEEQKFTLNAKIDVEEKDPALSATAGWQAVRTGGVSGESLAARSTSSDSQTDFELDTDGSLPFYVLDAYEELFGANAGNLYLFGKVKAGSSYQSCCVVARNSQRCIYAIPKGSLFPTDEMLKLEKDVEESRISPAEFQSRLHDLSSNLKKEVAQQLLNLNVAGFSMKPVKRKYAFERTDIPAGESYVLKINYLFKDPPLPTDLKGETFLALLGTHASALELFLIKRKIKGPSWLSVSKFADSPPAQKVSWCKFEVVVDSPKQIGVSSSPKHAAEIPPVIVTAINLKTIVNEKQNVNEIVSASIISCHKAKIESPMLGSEWKKPGMLSHFTVVRKLDGSIFPMGFTKDVTDQNLKAGSNLISFESSERALLNRLMVELYKLDSDVLVGHNISGFDLDVLLHRAQACKVPSSMWSKIGRLKRSSMPKLTRASAIFGSGPSPGIMTCIAGRLLCDTYLCSRDLLKEVSYSLTQLARTQLNKDRKEIAPHDVTRMFQTSESLLDLIEYGETDAWLSMELMFHLSILPLTRQLTNISGNLWGKTLQGARAQRVEYLLLHAFHAKKFIVPDKISSHTKESKSAKRKINHGLEAKNDEVDTGDANPESDAPHDDLGRRKKGPAYSGGLVLEPKRGLYDKYILLLDFNSLYPSIIQEYNICFTTVQRSQDGLVPRLPSSKSTGVLPELLRNLVQRRKMVKSWMKNATGLKVQQLDIQQQALKLTANSMYGCLGFSNSRFYAKPLAELITLQGREILQSTVDLVQNNLNLEVIYGDTDSIMIHTGLDDITESKAIAKKVIQEVNKKFRCLEIDLDGLYRRMLLLKKKKYAAVKVQLKDGTPYEVIERKGLDMVRRDWSLLSKELGDFCLSQILSGGSCEDVVESIHNSLMKVQEEMRNGQVALEKYVITKTLTKPPEAYPDAKSQPHVQVALRLKQQGYTTGCSAGDTVPYIICQEQGTTSGSSTGIAQCARHPDELKSGDGKWLVDIDYYLSQQIHPVVSRLCASIQGTSPERLADCLGLDSSKFRSKTTEALSRDPSSSLLFTVNDEERYQGCEPLILSCPSCSETIQCPPIITFICMSVNGKEGNPETEESTNKFWRTLRCPKCPEEAGKGRFSPASIANQVKRQADGYISLYYKGIMMCDDETCNHTTRSLNLRLVGDSERGSVCPNYPSCNGHLTRKYTAAALYKQLAYFCHILDTEHCVEKMEPSKRLQVEKELMKIRPLVNLAATTAQEIRDRSAYGWVQLNDLVVLI